MIKITVTIDEIQDEALKKIRIEKAKKGEIVNYSKVLRAVLNAGLAEF